MSDGKQTTKNESFKATGSNYSEPNFLPCKFFRDVNGSLEPWLSVFDSFFETDSNETSKTKFNKLLTSLPVDILSKLSTRIMTAKASSDPYEVLKQSLTTLEQEPLTQTFEKYFKTQCLGSQKPSEFLARAIKDLAVLHTGIKEDDPLLKRFFLSALPTGMQAILLVNESLKINEIALTADKIAEVMVNDCNACTISPTTNTPDIAGPDKLIAAISLLTDRISRLETRGDYDRNHGHNNDRNRNNSRDNTRFRSPSLNRNRNKLCYYHNKFKQGARLCNIGCEWRNRPSTCTLSDICIHHAKYKERAFSCIEGCKYFTTKNDVRSQNLNIPKN